MPPNRAHTAWPFAQKLHELCCWDAWGRGQQRDRIRSAIHQVNQAKQQSCWTRSRKFQNESGGSVTDCTAHKTAPHTVHSQTFSNQNGQPMNQQRTEIDTQAQIISLMPRSKAPSTSVASRQTPYTAKKDENAGKWASGMPQLGHRLTASTSFEKRSSIAALLAAYSDAIRGSSSSSSTGTAHSSRCLVPVMGMER